MKHDFPGPSVGLAVLGGVLALAALGCARREPPATHTVSSSQPKDAPLREPFVLAGGNKTVCFRVGSQGIECQGEHEGFFAGASELSLGYREGCVALAPGRWSCWGLAPTMRLEPGPSDYSAPGVDRLELPALRDMSLVRFALSGTYCGIRQGKVLCWGNNIAGALGYETNEPCEFGGRPCSHVPREVPTLAQVTDLALADGGGCALAKEGTVSCWGNFANSFNPHPPPWRGCLEPKDSHCAPPPPRSIAHLPPVAALAAPQSNAMFALGKDGHVYVWEGYAEPDAPRAVEGIEEAVKIATGGWGVCALLSSHRVVCASGSTRFTEHCPDPATQMEWVMSPAHPIDLVGDATDIAVTADFICVRRASGAFACWKEWEFGRGPLQELRPRLMPGAASAPPSASIRF